MNYVIELSEQDATMLLNLIYHEIKRDKAHPYYWINLSLKIKHFILLQKSGQFFQCSACTDERQDNDDEAVVVAL